MKCLVFICMFLVTSRSYSQDTLYRSTLQSIVQEFSKNNHKVTFYKALPRCIRHYLDQVNEGKFRISRILFNATDVGFGFSRKLSYIVRTGNDYILAYEHGGIGYHFHTIIFKTNGKQIISVYNLSTPEHKHLTELLEFIENRMYEVVKDEV